jgi:MFS family permease
MDMSGPLTGQIADYLGYRYSTFIGAIVMGISLIATSFSTRVWQLYIFQGILYGLGASLAFFPSLSLPSQWFKR